MPTWNTKPIISQTQASSEALLSRHLYVRSTKKKDAHICRRFGKKNLSMRCFWTDLHNGKDVIRLYTTNSNQGAVAKSLSEEHPQKWWAQLRHDVHPQSYPRTSSKQYIYIYVNMYVSFKQKYCYYMIHLGGGLTNVTSQAKQLIKFPTCSKSS